ncbi:MAG: hypothetical protein ACNA8G_09205 [Gammaproteobacteria bacterium]
MLKPGLMIFVTAALAGCGLSTGTLVDFGPEPGTAGDESYMQYQPELHGPEAVARAEREAEARAREAAAAPAPAAGALPALPPPPAATAAPPAPTSEALFNDAIRRAVDAGEIDRALKLLEEAERLGSRSARPIFIEAVGGRAE